MKLTQYDNIYNKTIIIIIIVQLVLFNRYRYFHFKNNNTKQTRITRSVMLFILHSHRIFGSEILDI